MAQSCKRSGRPASATAVSRLALVTALLATASFSPTARADTVVLPQGGAVVVGAATIKSNVPGILDVTTVTDRTAINWQSFSIGAGNTVNINQPNASSLTLNQVVGADPSSIFGSLKSNGQVVLANPNGIWFGPGSHVDVASIVASTATASQAALNAFASGGTLMLDRAGRPDASIVNDGSISIGEEGLAGLVAPGVANNGIIAARLGRVVLASGTVATLDFYGDGLISFAVGGSVTTVAKDQAGSPLSAAVVNAGTITNPGGTVLLTAAAAKTVIDDTINMSGIIVASAVNTEGGEIDLDGGTGTTNVSGELLASSKNATGGALNITGHTVELSGTTRLDATGANGGTIAIGGGSGGAGALAHATDVTLTEVSATANGTAGAGGTIAIWSDSLARVGGDFSAAGTTGGGSFSVGGTTVSVLNAAITADQVDLGNGTVSDSYVLFPSAGGSQIVSGEIWSTSYLSPLAGASVGLVIDGISTPITTANSGGSFSLASGGFVGTNMSSSGGLSITTTSNRGVDWQSFPLLSPMLIPESPATALVSTTVDSSYTGYGGGLYASAGGLVGTNAGSLTITSGPSIVSGGGIAAVGGLTGSNSGGPAIVQGTTLTAQSNDVVAQNPIPPVPPQPVATALVTSSPAPVAPPAARRPKAAIILPDSVLHPVVTVPTIALSLPQSSAGSDSIAAIETSLSGVGKLSPGN